MEWRQVKSKKGLEKFELYFATLSRAMKNSITKDMCQALQDYRQQELFKGKAKTLEMEAADKSASIVLRVPRGRKPRVRRPKYA